MDKKTNIAMTTADICKQAVEKYGEIAQVDMCIEECAELTVALQHYKRGRASKEEIITEIADVQIMCEQMQEIFGRKDVVVERHRKLKRLVERMEDK